MSGMERNELEEEVGISECSFTTKAHVSTSHRGMMQGLGQHFAGHSFRVDRVWDIVQNVCREGIRNQKNRIDKKHIHCNNMRSG